MKDNLGQECVNGDFYPSRVKLKQLPLISLEKGQFLPVLTLLFHLSLPTIWLFHPNKNYIFGMSNNSSIVLGGTGARFPKNWKTIYFIFSWCV